MMPKFDFTSKEFLLVLAIATLGFVFSSRNFILWLAGSSPLIGFFIYYGLVYFALYLLSKAGLVLWRVAIDKPLQLLGLMLITFSFLLVVDWESPYIEHVTNPDANIDDVSVLYFQSEDGAAYYFWNDVAGVDDEGTLRLLTYVLTPTLLSLAGALLVSGKINLGM